MKKKFVTLKDIANASGYSINTVSRALNNKQYVDKETKEKILKIAKEMNYFKNVTATSLRYSKTHTVGVVIVDAQNPFYIEVLKGIEYAAREKKYQVIFMNSDKEYELEEMAIKTFLERRVDGLIVSTTQNKFEDIKLLSDLNYPTVLIEYPKDGYNLDSVLVDNQNGGYIATKYLINKGRKNILMFNATEHKYASKMRCKGYLKAIEEYNLKEHILLSNEGYENAYNTFNDYIKKHGIKEIDAIFAYNDVFAVACYQVLKEKNIKIPEEIAIIGFDNTIESKIAEITTVSIDKFYMGKLAFEMLYERIKNKNKENEEKIFEVTIIERKTT
ncbi:MULTISPECIES: LacI family DNA-binding transcriptional regulator [Marinitoga]|jgi:LacI family transcriptional regulator|uniref:LacI family DNA-binding transcriptional regulator n=1 Tax=Marinitoga aeolica TaxID=2809031 RepID=A0ABY8PSM4_9BACT|nr:MULTISPECIES: LacI family DNA-binding transcriptional regulator [Marinitoga]MBM7558717.1 LacI family transcriptional regulator [Marinitoga litoralis]WGS65620.1 LacI family DNA-binding transcriptional regulator [Marinitoga aeolica]